MPKISACIVAYCDYDEVCSAVRSVLANTPGDDFALYVVDNASPDGCGPRLAQTDFGDVRVQVICLPKNLGFGKGHNSIMDRLTSDVHFILNPDVIIHDDILPQMAQWLLDHPGVVMATPQLYFPDGRIQNLPRRKPTPWLLLARQLAPRFGGVMQKADEHYTMQDEDLTIPRPIEFCTGSFAAIRTDVFKTIGGFDPEYFMYCLLYTSDAADDKARVDLGGRRIIKKKKKKKHFKAILKPYNAFWNNFNIRMPQCYPKTLRRLKTALKCKVYIS